MGDEDSIHTFDFNSIMVSIQLFNHQGHPERWFSFYFCLCSKAHFILRLCFYLSTIQRPDDHGDLPASVDVCLKARTWESDSPVSSEMTVSIMYSS